MITASKKSILLLVIRFLLFAAVYVGFVFWWAISEGGHGAMGILAGGVLLSGAAVTAWIAALVVGRYVVSPSLRFFVHVAITIALFTIIGVGIFMFLDMSDPFELMMSFFWPFGGIIAVAALAEGAIGLWRDQQNARAQAY